MRGELPRRSRRRRRRSPHRAIARSGPIASNQPRPSSTAAAKPERGRQILGAGPIAAFLPADRLDQRRIAQPAARRCRRPAQFMRRQHDDIGIGAAAACRPIWAQSASSSPPPPRTSAAISSIGWITPVSLLTAWAATSGWPRPCCKVVVERLEIDQPAAIDRDRPAGRRARRRFHVRRQGSSGASRPPSPSRSPRSRRWSGSAGHRRVAAPRRCACGRPRARRGRRGPRYAPRMDWPSVEPLGHRRRARGRIGVVAAWSR